MRETQSFNSSKKRKSTAIRSAFLALLTWRKDTRLVPPETPKKTSHFVMSFLLGALGGTRTPDLLVRSCCFFFFCAWMDRDKCRNQAIFWIWLLVAWDSFGFVLRALCAKCALKRKDQIRNSMEVVTESRKI